MSRRICEITTIHKPGDGRIYERTVLPLAEDGFHVILVAPWKGFESSVERCEAAFLKYPESRLSRLFHALRTFVAAMKVKADAYHFHDLDFLPLAVILKAIKRRPVIYDIHENYHLEIVYGKDWLPSFGRLILARFVYHMEGLCARILGRCIVVVPYQVKRFSAYGIDVGLVRNFARLVPDRNLTHQKNLLCVGTISESYGGRVLLDIGRLLKTRRFEGSLIVCDKFMTQGFRDTFLNCVRKENLPIVVHPVVAAQRIKELYSKGMIGLAVEQDTPAQREGYHGKLFEYMAMGLPVVASDIASNRCIVEKGGSGVCVAAADASAYVDAALSIMDDRPLYDRFRHNGFDAIETFFNWESERKNLLEYVYQHTDNQSS